MKWSLNLKFSLIFKLSLNLKISLNSEILKCSEKFEEDLSSLEISQNLKFSLILNYLIPKFSLKLVRISRFNENFKFSENFSGISLFCINKMKYIDKIKWFSY